jgi:hypothetical protein
MYTLVGILLFGIPPVSLYVVPELPKLTERFPSVIGQSVIKVVYETQAEFILVIVPNTIDRVMLVPAIDACVVVPENVTFLVPSTYIGLIE